MKIIEIEKCSECPFGRVEWIREGYDSMKKHLTCRLLNGPANRNPRTYFVIEHPDFGIPKKCKLKGEIEYEVEGRVKYS